MFRLDILLSDMLEGIVRFVLFFLIGYWMYFGLNSGIWIGGNVYLLVMFRCMVIIDF